MLSYSEYNVEKRHHHRKRALFARDLDARPGARIESRVYPMSVVSLLNAVAATDRTFRREEGDWVGRRLICGGPLRFDAHTGEGATIEHIMPRNLGGGNDLRNLGVAHGRCNGEKGRRWDPPARRRRNQDRYTGLVVRLREERERRWRDTAS
jgi:5-methylcytosine-specific restriction endonuclease McrA